MRHDIALITLLAVCGTTAAARISVDRIDPPHWWTGMHDTTLQLQISGHDIRRAGFSVDYPGVRLDSVARLDGSPDWQYVYLTVTPEARPGVMTLRWRDGTRTVTRDYELRARRPQRGAQGFSAADVLYLVMPDRFADGDSSNNNPSSLRHRVAVDRTDPNARHGGDFAGLRGHVGYIDSLGVTALWVNPVLANDMPGGSYHGYATTDYYVVDPRFGTNGEYVELVDTLHSHGIKTVMDMIFNHCGLSHPWVANPPASDWFNMQDGFEQTNYRLSTITDPYASDRDRRLTLDGWFVAEMPDLNQRNPHVMRYLTQNSIFWIEEAQIDGIRMDTYSYADRDAMKRWVGDVLAEYPGFNIVGECWLSDPAGESWWQGGSAVAAAGGTDTALPTVMDFPLMILSRAMAPYSEDTDSWHGLNAIYDHLALDFVYKDPMRVLRFLDNHDTERVLLTQPDSLDAWKQAVTILLTVPGIPQIYYGTELLMHGTRQGGDGNVRRDMPGGFPGDTVDCFTRQGRTPMQNEAYDFISRLCRWRRGSKAVAQGSMKHFLPDNGLYVYRRQSPDDEVIVMINGRGEEVTAPLSRYAEILDAEAEYTDILTGAAVSLDPRSEVTMKPRQILLLQRKK